MIKEKIGLWKLHYEPNSEGCGFEAMARYDDDIIRFHALSDGVRHLEVNPGKDGYIYYPEDITKLFIRINELIVLYCSEGQYEEM